MHPTLYRLDHLSGLLFSGDDAASFLQGQLSNDVETLTSGQCQLTSLSNPKGRIITLAYLASLDRGLLMILPTDMTRQIAQHLQRYIFRAKVTLTQPGLEIAGTLTPPQATRLQDPLVLAVDPSKTLHFVVNFDSKQSLDSETPTLWRQAWIRSGRPWIEAATQESFVAQMLNLDLLQGISWEKGCYTGQEIIARTHYRGRNKRRMLGFTVATNTTVTPGMQIYCADQKVGTVVSAVKLDDTQELLAVLKLTAFGTPLTLQRQTHDTLKPFDLPYEIPELTGLHSHQ